MGKRTRGITALVAVVAALGGWASGADAQQDTNAFANWTNGSGDCPEGGIEQVGGNGTAYLARFDIDADVVVEDDVMTVTFVGFNGNAFFSPVAGPIKSDGSFDLAGSYEPGDEDYNFRGRLEGKQLTGTFQRIAHYSGLGTSGPRCTATWDVTVTISGSAPDLPKGGQTSSTGGDDNSGINVWIFVFIIGIILAIVGLWFALGRTRERPPKEPEPVPDGDIGDDEVIEDEPPIEYEEVGEPTVEKPPPAKVSERPACSCSARLEIGGRDSLRVCECLDLKWETRPSALNDARLIVVRGLFPDGELFCGRRYRLERLTGECTGGGKLYDTVDKVHKWDLTKGPGQDELTLKCSANARYWCPDAGWRDMEVAAEKVIKILKVKCMVSIIINEDAYYLMETGHTGMRIRCGEYDTVFGYFPENEAATPNVLGIESRGVIKEASSRDDEQVDSLAVYYQSLKRRQYWFDASCATCEKLRQSWSDLWNNPGNFNLYDHNCTTVVANIVMREIELPEKTVVGWHKAMGGFASPGTLNRHLEAGGLEPVIHEEGQLLHPKDH